MLMDLSWHLPESHLPGTTQHTRAHAHTHNVNAISPRTPATASIHPDAQACATQTKHCPSAKARCGRR